jgi:hypothetical protein
MQSQATSWDIRSFFPYTRPVIVLLVSVFLLLVPVVKLLRRTGHHPLWCLFAIFPALNLIAFWYFAYKPWPTDKESRSAETDTLPGADVAECKQV